jgi:hypothetical protein
MPTRYQTTLLNAAAATGAGAFIQGDDRLPSFATFQVTITGTATVTFQGNTDGTTTYQTIPVTSVAASPVTANTVTASGIYRCDISAAQIRPNVTSYGSGTVTVVVSVSQGTLSGGASSGSSGGSSAVTAVAGAFADGAITTMGTTTDPVVTAPSSAAATEISLLKGIDQGVNTVPTTPLPVSVQDITGTYTQPTGDAAARAVYVIPGGAAAAGSAVSGNPVLIAGTDGTNTQTVPVFAANASITSSQELLGAFALGAVLDGTALKPMYSANNTGDGTILHNSPAVGLWVYDPVGSVWDRAQLPNADNASPTGVTGTCEMLFNGTTAKYDRRRNNVEVTALASGARTATINSGNITTYNARGLTVVLNVSSAGTGSITLSILGLDSLSTNTYTILAGTAVTTNSTNVYRVFPGATAAANAVANDQIPRIIQINVVANNANSMTYSVNCQFMGY